MDLPTYTNIWRIEKRLYKLYDVRLPMPLPIVWIGVFVGVLVPWSLLLWLVGVPPAMPWHVVYLVPPGVVTWLATRPVIEGKRLTELLQSQLRYLGEPRTWSRMAPDAEPAEISLTARVWRAAPREVAPVRVKAARTERVERAERAGKKGRWGALPRPQRAATASRQVRPAVAAAAVAAARAPVAEPAAPVSETAAGRGTAVAARRRGVAPALGAAMPEAASQPPAVPPVTSISAFSPGPVTPVSPTGEPAASGGNGVAAPGHRDGSAGGCPAPVAGGGHAPAAGDGHGREAGDGHAREAGDGHARAGGQETPAPTPPPIGAEALRRLRRLAAYGDPEGLASADPEPAAEAREAVVLGMSSAAPAESHPPESHASEPRPPVDPPGPAAREIRSLPPVQPDRSPQAHATERSVPPSGVPTADADLADRGLGREPGAPSTRSHEPGSPPVRSREPGPPPLPIRTVAAGPVGGADPAAPTVPVPVPLPGEGEARIRRVESVVGREQSGGWRRLAQVVIGSGGGRTDGSEVDEARARADFDGGRRIVVLGCTGGAGQTTTALMLGHTLARHRDDRILAVDASTGTDTLTSKIDAESPETLASLLAGLDQVGGYLNMRAYTSCCPSGLEVVGADTDAGAEQRLTDRSLLSDHRLGQAMELFDRHYKLVVVDPAAALAARVLPYADQLVLVAPASEDAPDAVAMTYEWLDGHGCADLRRRAVTVVNGVSRRSIADVEQAEAVARGRCRAIVRVPWEDGLAPGVPEAIDPGRLRAAGRRAYLALAGVVVAGFAGRSAVRRSEEEVAQ